MSALFLAAALLQAPNFQKAWSIRFQTEIQSSFLADGKVFFGTNDAFGALNETTGKKVWARSFKMPQLGAYIVFSDGAAYASTGQGYLMAVDSNTGKDRWMLKRSGYASPIAAYSGTVFAEMKPGVISALQAGNGKSIWQTTYAKPEPQGLPPGLATRPIRQGQRLFLGTKSGLILALDSGSGKIEWQYNKQNASAQAVVIAGDRLIAAFDDGAIFGLSLETGQRMWANFLTSGLAGSPVYKDGRIFATSPGGDVVSYAAMDGRQLWRAKLSGRQNFGLSQPLPFDDGFLLANRTKLMFLDGSGGQKWEWDSGEDLFGQPPRPIGEDLLLTGSHQFIRINR